MLFVGYLDLVKTKRVLSYFPELLLSHAFVLKTAQQTKNFFEKNHENLGFEVVYVCFFGNNISSKN